jgi:hypothetical protein
MDEKARPIVIGRIVPGEQMYSRAAMRCVWTASADRWTQPPGAGLGLELGS